MKRRHFEIKDAILEALSKYPHNTSQLTKRLGTGKSTVEKHLEELNDLQQVRKIKTEIRGEEKEVWEKVR